MLCEKAQLIFAVMKTRDTEAKKKKKANKQKNNKNPKPTKNKPETAKFSTLEEKCAYGVM